jgi:sugar fermentation stimulation protein A
MRKYLFKKTLAKGLIKSRPNRFLMIVEVKGKKKRCHCPATGRIGDVNLPGTPCLLSESKGGKRKTKCTVEAISINHKEWIGINQTRVNDYVAFFLRTGQLNQIIKVNKLKREVPLGNSRIDFLINDRHYLEVKTPLNLIRAQPQNTEQTVRHTSMDRMIKHLNDASKSVSRGSRAIFILCHMFAAPKFQVPPHTKQENKIIRTARMADRRGLEHWQLNLKVDPEGVTIIDCFPLKLF